MRSKILKTITVFSVLFILLLNVFTNVASAEVTSTDVAEIEGQGYATLQEALEVANASDTATTIKLLKDVALAAKLVINKDVTIEGNYTITRQLDDSTTTDVDETYKGRLFEISLGAKLTLDGRITIDGANNWIFKETEYFAEFQYRLDYYEGRLPEGSPAPSAFYGFAFVTPEEGAPIVNDHLIVVNGEIVINSATLTNHCGEGEKNVLRLGKEAIATLNNGAKIVHNAISSRGTSIFMADNSLVYINEGAEISGNYAAYNGGSVYNNGGTITMNGGKINNNYGVRTNGIAIMLHQNSATLIMNGGEICGNSGLPADGAGHCCAIYLHSTGIMEMNGGSICHNTGMTNGAVMVMSSNAKLNITGGYIGENKNIYASNPNYESLDLILGHADILNFGTTKITGGTFTQDVTEYCEEEYYYLPISEGKGIVSKCTTHEFVDSVCTVCTYECPHSTTAVGDKPATCAEKAYCSVCQNVYGELLEHNYTCVANDEENTLHVTCDKGCGYDETLKIEVPTELVYNGNSKPAVLSGEIVNMPVVEYDTVDGQAPVEAGTYTATIKYEDKSVSVEYTIVPAIPVMTITSPTPAIIPGTSMVLKVEIKNPENEGLEDLPENFVIKYKVGTSDQIYEIAGLRLTIPSDVALGQSIYVYVENEEVAGKYGVGQSNVLTLYVGQIDYSGDIDAVAKALEQAKEELKQALELGDEELNTKVEALQNALINVNNILTTIPDEYATKQELADAKAELETKIEEAKTEVLEKVNQALETAKAELEALIDTKANTTDVEAAIKELKEAVELAEQAAKDFATTEDEALKVLLEQAIEDAKQAAINTANQALETAKAELETLIDTKADKVTLEEKVKELTEAIEIAKQAAKEFAVEEDLKLKLYFEQAIEEANELIQAVEERVTANEIAIENINAAIEALKKVDEEHAEALAKAVGVLREAIDRVGESSAAMDEALDAKLTEARDLLIERIEKIKNDLKKTKAELEAAIKSGEDNLEEEINKLNKAIEAAKIALEAEDEKNKEELEAKIEEGTKALEAAIKEVQNRLDNVKTELEKADIELQAKDNELQRTITIICIVLCILICLYAAFMVWYIIDRKRLRK